MPNLNNFVNLRADINLRIKTGGVPSKTSAKDIRDSLTNIVDTLEFLLTGATQAPTTQPITTPIPTTLPPTTAGFQPIRLNVGGSFVGNFATDALFTGGQATPWVLGNTIVETPDPRSAPPDAYITERYAINGLPFSYIFPGLNPATSYTVRLGFSENWFNAPGQRQFHVDTNSVRRITNLDIFAATGKQAKALVVDLLVTPDGSGNIEVAFVHGAADVPCLHVIELLAASAYQTTAVPTTLQPTTQAPPTTPATTLVGQTTPAPTTLTPTTQQPTTARPTTQTPITTAGPSTVPPSTGSFTTDADTLAGDCLAFISRSTVTQGVELFQVYSDFGGDDARLILQGNSTQGSTYGQLFNTNDVNISAQAVNVNDNIRIRLLSGSTVLLDATGIGFIQREIDLAGCSNVSLEVLINVSVITTKAPTLAPTTQATTLVQTTENDETEAPTTNFITTGPPTTVLGCQLNKLVTVSNVPAEVSYIRAENQNDAVIYNARTGTFSLIGVVQLYIEIGWTGSTAYKFRLLNSEASDAVVFESSGTQGATAYNIAADVPCANLRLEITQAGAVTTQATTAAPTTQAPSALVFDDFTNMYYMVGTARMRTAHTGPLFSVRRVDTGAQLDIPADGQNHDSQLLNDHVGTAEWQYVRWHDQRGSTRYAENISAKGCFGKQGTTLQLLGTNNRLSSKWNAQLPTTMGRSSSTSIPANIGGNLTLYAVVQRGADDFSPGQTIIAKATTTAWDFKLFVRKSDGMLILARTDAGVGKTVEFAPLAVGGSYVIAVRITNFTTAAAWIAGGVYTGASGQVIAPAVNNLTENVDAATRIDVGSVAGANDFWTGKINGTAVQDIAETTAKIQAYMANRKNYYGI